MKNPKTTADSRIPASLHLPVPGIVHHPDFGLCVTVGVLPPALAGDEPPVGLDGNRWARVEDLTVPLDKPVNHDSLTRKLWERVTGIKPHASEPVRLVGDGEGAWWLESGGEEQGSWFAPSWPGRDDDYDEAPLGKLEGIVDPLAALVIIATVVLGGAL